MARKPKPVAKPALPKLPFSMRDRAAYIDRPWVAVARMGTEYLASVYFSFASGLIQVAAVGVHEINADRNGHGGSLPFYVDGHHFGFGPTGLAQTHLQWLKNQALRGGATPDAIGYLASAMKLTKKEQDDMAKAATAKKTTASKTKPVGSGGKLGTKGGNPAALEKAREAAAAKNAANDALKITLLVGSKDLGTDKAKLRGGRLAKLKYLIDNKPKTVADVRGKVVKDEEGDEHTIDMGALRGMEKRGHIKLG